MRPELNSGRNLVEREFLPGQKYAWLDPELPATFKVIEDVLADVATIFRGPYIHIGGDEPRLPPLFVVRAARPGTRPLDRQASTRMAGVSPCRPRPGRHPVLEVRDRGERRPASRRRRDGSGGLGTRKSHCYLDVPYAESSADPGQAERQGRVGQRVYSPKTVAESFDWEPAEALGPCRAAHVAGVEAAIWTETIADFDDLCFLLLPRASHTRLGATRRSPPGSTTAIVSLDTADCGRETASRTSAPPRWTGVIRVLIRQRFDCRNGSLPRL